ncbi:MAG: tetraacyldisaccharide 4'-kinase [Alphaproteobacteria bacterium]
MNAPEFWWRREASAAAIALWPLARLWGLAASWRMRRRPAFRPPVPVMCVGNFVVGGAGKTPTVLALARSARGRGLKPGILASGYGGAVAAPVLVDPAIHDAGQVGDEALLLTEAAPTVVAADRVAGARRLLSLGASIIIMDDGFQNPSLVKDITLIVVDAGAGIGNGRVMPAGPLRAPLGMQLRRADSLLVIGDGEHGELLIRSAARAGRPVTRGTLRPTRIREWRRGRILAFAGIGRPQKFFDTLNLTKADVFLARAFPDHHVYTQVEAAELLDAAEAEDLRLVTTEKDYVRLAGASGRLAELREKAEPFPVALKFENPLVVGELIDEAVRRAASAGR